MGELWSYERLLEEVAETQENASERELKPTRCLHFRKYGIALIFIAEYGIIILFYYITLLTFRNLLYIYSYSGVFMIRCVVIIFIWRVLPRVRYD